MPHDCKGRLIEVGDFVRTKPFNQEVNRPYVGPIVSMNNNGGTSEPDQSCTGQIKFIPDGQESPVDDYFAADDARLILKADGSLPEGDESP